MDDSAFIRTVVREIAGEMALEYCAEFGGDPIAQHDQLETAMLEHLSDLGIAVREGSPHLTL